jgi:hypothetical protein
MNYTKLTINDQDVGLKFGMHAARYLAAKFSGAACFDGDTITEIGISHIIYGGYLNNCAVKDIAPSLSFEDIVDFVESSVGDSAKVSNIAEAVKVWSDCQIVQAAAAGVDDGKKKVSRKSRS